jgi:hypothetical protein
VEKISRTTILLFTLLSHHQVTGLNVEGQLPTLTGPEVIDGRLVEDSIGDSNRWFPYRDSR